MNRETSGPFDARWMGRAALAVLARPSLWITALRQVVVMAAPRWWARSPHLPLPDADYFRFRLVTAYGDSERAPEPHDVVTYLHWCRGWRHHRS